MTRLALLSLVLLLDACCTSSSDDAPPPTAPTARAPERDVPALVVGAAPVVVEVPPLPRYAFTVERAGEYAIGATGAPLSPQLRLFSGESVVMQAGGGEAADARIVTFLDPGTYEIQIGEWRSRALDAQVSLERLTAMPPAATLTPGDAPAIVHCPRGTAPREASVEVALTITAPGSYRIDASSTDGTRDAELSLLLDGGLLQADSDSGDESNARIVRELAPGSYTVRVRDWLNREATITVAVERAPTE